MATLGYAGSKARASYAERKAENPYLTPRILATGLAEDICDLGSDFFSQCAWDLRKKARHLYAENERQKLALSDVPAIKAVLSLEKTISTSSMPFLFYWLTGVKPYQKEGKVIKQITITDEMVLIELHLSCENIRSLYKQYNIQNKLGCNCLISKKTELVAYKSLNKGVFSMPYDKNDYDYTVEYLNKIGINKLQFVGVLVKDLRTAK